MSTYMTRYLSERDKVSVHRLLQKEMGKQGIQVNLTSLDQTVRLQDRAAMVEWEARGQ